MKTFVVPEPRVGALRAFNYSPAIERIRRAGSDSSRPLKSLVRALGESYGSRFVNIHCAPAHGVEVLSQSEMFRSEPNGRFIRRDCIPHPKRHRISQGDVLIAGAGTLGDTELFGHSLLADRRMDGKHVGPHALVLRFKEPLEDDALFAYAWLASPTGVQAVRAACYGTKILGLRLDLLSETPIPLAPRKTVARVAALVRRCAAGREAYAEGVHAARALVRSVPAVAAAHDACSVRRRRSVLWPGPFYSLGAWNVAGAGDALSILRDRSPLTLADFLGPRGMYYGGRSARVPCKTPYGFDFVTQRDAFLTRPIPRRVVLPGVAKDMLLVPEGSLLIAGRGTLGEGEIFGRSVQAVGRHKELVFTEDMLRLTLVSGYSHIIYAFLSSHLGVQLIRTAGVGTKILKLRDDLMRRLPVPSISEKQAADVNRLMEAANAERAEADEAESSAIGIIENEVLPQWLA